MALQINPTRDLDDIVLNEEVAYTLDCTAELDTNTINSHAYTIHNPFGVDVTSSLGGGSTENAGIINFGIIASQLGIFHLKFVVTCNEFLPDGTTPYEFIVKLQVKINNF